MNPESEDSKPSLLPPEILSAVGKLDKEQEQELIFRLISKQLIAALSSGECNPQWIAQARAFLADNKVTGSDLPGTPLAAVKEAFKAKVPFKS
jgi:hypothetical protein